MAEEQQQQDGGAAAEASPLDLILDAAKVDKADASWTTQEAGLKALMGELTKPERAGKKLDPKIIDSMIAELDERLGNQLDTILHNPDFQKMESAWRGLKLVVDRTDFRENVKLELLNVSKEDLLTDFEDAPEIT